MDSLDAYGRPERAEAYHRRGGFDPPRKRAMLDAALDLLVDLAPGGGDVLELGAGTGAFTRMLLSAGHFGRVAATDGAAAMLDVARRELGDGDGRLSLRALDFTHPGWADEVGPAAFAAVASTLAIHHAPDKAGVFAEARRCLCPGGVLVVADHLSGATDWTGAAIGRFRGRIRLGARARPEEIADFLRSDAAKQAQEGNRCESLAAYLGHLGSAGLRDADCLWRDRWLAVFVARNPGT